eukprot:s3889_g5.t1
MFWGGRFAVLAMVLFCTAGAYAMPLEPTSKADRERQTHRAGNVLVSTRAVKEQTRAKRKIYLDRFRSWLWGEHQVSLKFLLEAKPPDPEEISKHLIAYGRELYAAGRSYGIYAETINAVAVERPLVRRQLNAAWDVAFCWLCDEPHQHHPALPITVMAALVTIALTWGWPHEAAVIMLGWAGILRIGEVLAATRAELVLPCDAVPGTSFALLMVRQPKTRGRSANHQAARVDQQDVIEFLNAMYGRSSPEVKLWPFSASTLRKRFGQLLAALKLPTEKSLGYQPFSLGSLRPGGATWLLHATEQPELVRRRGRWLSSRVMEIYLQEVLVTTFAERISSKSRELIHLCSGGYAATLERCVAFLHGGIPPKAWYHLLKGEGGLEQSAEQSGAASGNSTWAVSGKANADDLQIWMQLLSTKFSSLQEAYWSWCGNMSGRMSQASFMRATKDLQFQGDAKLIWDTLTRGVPGFLSVEEFARPDMEACFAKAAEANVQGDEERPVYAEDEEVVAAEEAEEEEPTVDAEEELEGAEVLEPVQMETLLDFAQGPRDMSLEVIAEACRKLQDDKEPRFPSGVEERMRLLHEDLQRQQELLASGAASTARLVAAAASAASAAASLSLTTPTLDVDHVHLTPELPDLSRLLQGLESGIGSCNTLEEAIEPINSLLSEFAPDDLPAPTTSVDANVLMSDASELRVSLQTNVIARPKVAEDVPTLILEVWAFEGVGTEAAVPEYQLLAQVDCSQIVDVLQHGPLAGDLMFEVLLKPGADFLQVDPRSLAIANNAAGREGERHGPSELRHRSWLVDTRQQPSLFTSEELDPLDTSPSGLLLSMKCSFIRAPAWTKLEAARFFDELRILARFVQPQLEDVQAEAKKIYATMLMTSLDSFKVFATHESCECFGQVEETYCGSDGGSWYNDLH